MSNKIKYVWNFYAVNSVFLNYKFRVDEKSTEKGNFVLWNHQNSISYQLRCRRSKDSQKNGQNMYKKPWKIKTQIMQKLAQKDENIKTCLRFFITSDVSIIFLVLNARIETSWCWYMHGMACTFNCIVFLDWCSSLKSGILNKSQKSANKTRKFTTISITNEIESVHLPENCSVIVNICFCWNWKIYCCEYEMKWMCELRRVYCFSFLFTNLHAIWIYNFQVASNFISNFIKLALTRETKTPWNEHFSNKVIKIHHFARSVPSQNAQTHSSLPQFFSHFSYFFSPFKSVLLIICIECWRLFEIKIGTRVQCVRNFPSFWVKK